MTEDLTQIADLSNMVNFTKVNLGALLEHEIALHFNESVTDAKK